MSKMICRLCLNDGKLFDVFDSRLTNSEQLIKCILLGTGVEICREDAVTKYVCQYCSDLAIFLYRYRKKALANDKALKELASQQFTGPLSETAASIQSNRHLFEGLETQVEKILITPETNPETYRKRPVLPLNSAVHPTIIDLIKTYPRLKIPNHLVQCHIEPRVVLNPKEVTDWVPPPTPAVDIVPTQPISDLEWFKLMCPGIHITKVRESAEAIREQPEIVKVDKPNASNKRKLTESPVDITLKKRKVSPVVMSSQPERCTSSMAVPVTKQTVSKRRRSQTPAPCIEKPVPKLKISLRRSPDHSEISAVVTSIPPILNQSENSGQNLDHGIQQPPIVQRKQESSREPLVIRRSSETSEEPPAFHISKGSFMESLSMERKRNSPQESPLTQGSREPSVESPAIQDNIEVNRRMSSLVPPEITDETETITPRIFNRNRLIMESESDDDDRGFDTENLLDTFTEEIVINCGVCNKMFTTPQQLKTHERVHRCCTICKVIFRSLDALIYHQREICFKKVIANPPNLALVRVDEQPETAKVYLEAFTRQEESAVPNEENIISDVLCISDDDDDDDDDVIVVGESTQKPKDMNSEEYKQSPSEFQFISRIFGKYSSLAPPNTKVKATETKPKIFIRYNLKGQIVLENMFSELQTYRVPVELVAKPNSFAYISFTKKVSKGNNIYCWVNEPVIGLNEKKSFLSILLNTQGGISDTQRTPQGILAAAQSQSTPKTINNFKTVQIPTKMAPTPTNTSKTSVTTINETQPPITVTQTPPSEIVVAGVPVIITQAPINATQQAQAPLQLVQPPQNQMAISRSVLKAPHPHRTYSHQIPSTSNSAYFGTIVTTSSLVLPQPVPSTSTSSENNFGLRVKSLSELS